jgi:site-specific DNA-methyltransferase (adenine-specific)/modification methylase
VGGVTPYYERDGMTLYNADALDVLPLYPPAVVALLLADPPYGMKLDPKNSDRGGKSTLKGGIPPLLDWPRCVGDDRPFDPTPLLVYSRVVLWGANHYAHRLPPSPSWLVWDKRKGTSSDFNADCEMAWTNLGGPARLYSQLWRGVCKRGEEAGQRRLHQMQKPAALGRWIIGRATQPGDLVLVPYAGSGSEMLAALQTGRRCVGVEIEERYCEVAAKRLQQVALPLEAAI